jgi:hypothetical protein
MSTQAIEIPFLTRRDKVVDWRKNYLAATALLNAEQQLRLFPVYAGKNADEGERMMIDFCSKKTTVKLALDELEVLRDGEPPKLTLINRFYETTPILSSYKSFFFELIHAGNKAGVSCQMVMLRYLSLCPGGQKFYDSNKAEIDKAEMNEGQAVALYKLFAPRLDTLSGTSKDVEIKEESGFSAFMSEQVDVPVWARELKEEIQVMQRTLSTVTGDSYSYKSDSEDEVMYTNKSSGSSSFLQNGNKKKRIICSSCSKPGHEAENCWVKCMICSGKGHHSKVCPSKTFDKKKSKRPS